MNQDTTHSIRQELGQHTAAYDVQTHELRLSWPDGQTLLDQAECYALLDLLNAHLPTRPWITKPFHVQCEVSRHLAHEERFEDKEAATSYARKMQGQWTKNTLDKQFHQFTRISIEEYGQLVSEWSIGLRDQGQPPESEVIR